LDESVSGPIAKKAKVEEKPLTRYEQEVLKHTPKTIKDVGTGVRPMIK